MINKETFLKVLMERIEKLPKGHYLDIRSYKRNRSIFVIRKGQDNFFVIENGFYQDKFHVKFDEIRRLFRKLLKKEFPLSHKIRVYTMGKYNPIEAKKIKRKEL